MRNSFWNAIAVIIDVGAETILPTVTGSGAEAPPAAAGLRTITCNWPAADTSSGSKATVTRVSLSNFTSRCLPLIDAVQSLLKIAADDREHGCAADRQRGGVRSRDNGRRLAERV